MNKQHRAILLIVLSVLLVSCVGHSPTLKQFVFPRQGEYETEGRYAKAERYATYWMNEDNRVVIHRTDILEDDYAYDEATILTALGNIKSQRDFYFTEEAYKKQLEIFMGAYRFAYPYWHPNLKKA